MKPAPERKPVGKFPLPYVVRPMKPEDLEVIGSTWLHTQRYAPASRFIPSDLYYDYQRRLIDTLLKSAAVSVAADPEEKTTYGYVVHGPPASSGIAVIHQLYVKETYRRMGLAKELLAHVVGHRFGDRPIYATHASTVFRWPSEKEIATAPSGPTLNPPLGDILARYGVVYVPYLLRGV